jgi:hypothetical protein
MEKSKKPSNPVSYLLGITSSLFPSLYPTKILRSFLISYSPLPQLHQPNKIFWKAQIMKLLDLPTTLVLLKVQVFSINLSMALQSFVGSWLLFRVLNPIHSRYNSLDGGSARRKAATYTQNNTNRINAHRHTCLGWDSNSRFPAFERAKTVHALDRAATVIGTAFKYYEYIYIYTRNGVSK